MDNGISSWVMDASVIPTPQQTLLIKACVLKDKRSIDFFHAWLATLQFNPEQTQLNHLNDPSLGLPQVYDQLDKGSQRLLSLLYRNQIDQGNLHVIIKKLHGYYKYVWYRNQLLKGQLTALIEEFRKIEVEVIILKGIAQLEKYQPYEGTRPTMDIDICIRKSDFLRATKMLTEKGWLSKYADPNQIDHSLIHAHTFTNGRFEVDVHHRFTLYPLKEKTEQLFWDSSTVHQKGYRTLSHAHELYIILLHGCQWNLIPPIRWVTDCIYVLDQFTTTDWSDFVVLLQEEEYSIFPLLDYLQREHFVVFPEDLLQQQRTKRMKRIISKQVMYSLQSSEVEKFIGLKTNYYRAAHMKRTPVMNHLLKHYLYMWRLNSYTELVKAGLKKVWMKLNSFPVNG